MTRSEDAVAIARSYSEAINARDWDRLRRHVLAPDVEAWSHSAQHLERGPEEIVGGLQNTTGAVADAHIEVVNAVVGDDQVVLELRIVGINHGDPNARDGGPTPSDGQGRPVALSTCHVYCIRDGKISHLTTYSDRTWRSQS